MATGSATKRNPDFVQLKDPDGIKAMRLLTKANPMAANVFYLFMQYMDKSNCLIVSMATIGSKLDISRPTVYRAVKYLKENRYIAVLKSGTTNVYCLNSDIVWKDNGDKRLEALLYGAVLLSLDEQEKPVKENKQLRLV